MNILKNVASGNLITKKDEINTVLNEFKKLRIKPGKNRYPEPVFGYHEIKVTEFDDPDAKSLTNETK